MTGPYRPTDRPMYVIGRAVPKNKDNDHDYLLV